MKNRSGQVMLLVSLAIGGTILAATSIAGLLTIYQIRQTTDLANSTRAIYGADSALEWGLYQVFCYADPGKSPCPLSSPPAFPTLSNDTEVSAICYDANNQPLGTPPDYVDSCICKDGGGNPVVCAPGTFSVLRATGKAGDSTRVFAIGL